MRFLWNHVLVMARPWVAHICTRLFVTVVVSAVIGNRADDTAPCCSGLGGRIDRGIVVAEAYGHVVPAHRGDGIRHR